MKRAEKLRVDLCASQSDCREGYACVDDEDGAGRCLPVAAIGEFRVFGHAKRLR